MSTVKLKTNKSWKAGIKNILPFVGEVKFDDNAIIEVSVEQAKSLIEYSAEFSLVGEEKEEDIKKKSEDAEELGKSDVPDISPQVEESEVLGQVKNEPASEIDESQKTESHQDIKDKIREKLSELKVKELREQYLSKFPEELIKDLKNREQYIEFLVNELSK